MAEITQPHLMAYIAQCAESIIEDDMNESGDYTEEEHDELVRRAMTWCYDQYQADQEGSTTNLKVEVWSQYLAGLIEDSHTLAKLEAAGVDNWIGYDLALSSDEF